VKSRKKSLKMGMKRKKSKGKRGGRRSSDAKEGLTMANASFN